MVGFITGGLYGFGRSSASVLDYMGLLGSPSLGRGNEGVFVNASNGNLILQRQDEYVAARGHDLDVTRTYNSLSVLADDNNDRWRQSTDRRITLIHGALNQVDSWIARIDGDGSRVKYKWDPVSSSYLSTDGGGAYATAVSGTEWVWESGDGQRIERYNNDANGFIKSVEDLNGSVQTFTYDSQGRLSRVTSANGDWTEYSYTGTSNNIDTVVTGYTDYNNGNTAKTLTRTRYGYESYSAGSWRLKTVTVDLSPTDNSIADNYTYVTTYSYDTSSPLRITGITQSDGSAMSISYDASGRVTDLVQTAVSGVTRTTHLDYFTGYTRITDPLGQVTQLDYDAAGNLTKITAPPASAGAPQQVVQRRRHQRNGRAGPHNQLYQLHRQRNRADGHRSAKPGRDQNLRQHLAQRRFGDRSGSDQPVCNRGFQRLAQRDPSGAGRQRRDDHANDALCL